MHWASLLLWGWNITPLTALNLSTAGRKEGKQLGKLTLYSRDALHSYIFLLLSHMKQRWVCTTPTDNSTLPVWFHSVVRHLGEIFLWRMDLSHNPLTLRPIRDGRDMSPLPDKDSPAAALGPAHVPGLPPEPRDLCNLQCQDVFGYGKLRHCYISDR